MRRSTGVVLNEVMRLRELSVVVLLLVSSVVLRPRVQLSRSKNRDRKRNVPLDPYSNSNVRLSVLRDPYNSNSDRKRSVLRDLCSNSDHRPNA
jgi:hypothetical protein